ncbi:MAG: glycosyltransferase, partial [bacterium]|nr:glycosyltransferase [bacterium]
MRVLNLSLDKNVLKEGSLVQRRLISLAGKHGTDTEEVNVTVLMPGKRDEQKRISPHLVIHAVGGFKILQFFKMWRKGKGILKHHPLSISPSTERERQEYNLITVQDAYFVGLIGFLLARKFNIPLEIQVHGLEQYSGLRKIVANFLLPRATKIRVVSERLQRELISNFQFPISKFYILPVYTQVETALRSVKKGLPVPFTFLTVGRLVPVKNIALQIRAFARLVREVPHVRLVIVGSGAERSNLQFLISNFQLKDKVILAGRQENLERYYQEADAFLLTSDSEGYGVVVTEAAAYKLPIIMTNVGLAGEFIKHDESGIIIPVGNEDELFGAMKELVEKPELRLRLG